MQSSYLSSKFEAHSQTIITLNRQIEALCPIRISYENLQNYHNKITYDLQSLIEQHDYAISSLKANLQNLLLIGNRTEQQRNYLLEKLKDLENQNAKVIFDTKNLAQKLQSLNQKLKLEVSQNQSNESFSGELENIFVSLKNHCEALQSLNNQLRLQQNQMNSELQKIQEEVVAQKQNNTSLQVKADEKKSKIASLNLKNDDLIDVNNKLSQQLHTKQQEVNSKNKLNRVLKQKMIELTSDYQKLKNQIEYKKSLLDSQIAVLLQHEANQKSISTVINTLSQQKSKNQNQNLNLQDEITQLQRLKDQNIRFKLNSENHLVQLKKTNEVLLQKMEQYCIQDRQLQNLLLKKMSVLQMFSKRLNRQYEFDRQKTNIFRQKLLAFNERSLNVHRPSYIKETKQEKFENTRTSSKSPWLKQNFA